jgi:acyl-CoA thioesterase I
MSPSLLQSLKITPHCGNPAHSHSPYTGSVPFRRQRLTLFPVLFAVLSALFLLRPTLSHAAAPQLLVCFGDSITAGYGLEESQQAYPADLQRDLNADGYHYRVLNRGTSGATTKDAVATLPEILALHPDVVIVEIGGNDGLRGLPLDQTRRNLNQILDALAAAHSRVLLGGITLPPNYGPDYIHSFEQVYRDVAAAHPRDAFVPMIYKDLVTVSGAIQPDGIHPTAKGAAILARTLLPALRPLLTK